MKHTVFPASWLRFDVRGSDGVGIAFYNDHHDFDWTMFLKYHPTSTDFWMKAAGEDPKMTDFVNRQRRELDVKKREQIFQDYTKYFLTIRQSIGLGDANRLDDEAGIPPLFQVNRPLQQKPDTFRLYWFDGENAGGHLVKCQNRVRSGLSEDRP